MKKKIIFAFLSAFSAFVAVMVFTIYREASWLTVEDKVYDTYLPLVIALDDYVSGTGCAASELQDLVPHYIDKLPGTAEFERIEYCVRSNKCEWELNIISTRKKQTRIYVIRSDNEYTQKEREASVKNYHVVWNIFDADDFNSSCSEP